MAAGIFTYIPDFRDIYLQESFFADFFASETILIGSYCSSLSSFLSEE